MSYLPAHVCNSESVITFNNNNNNHIMYADDLVLILPSSAGLSQLLHECEQVELGVM